MSRRFERLAFLCLIASLLGPALGCERVVDWRDLSSGDCPKGEKPCLALLRCVRMDDPSTGCADLTTCAPCALPHATATCGPDGACRIADCLGDHLDCDPTALGCETDSTHDANHCGSCEQHCTTANGFPGCSGGHCTVGGCLPGFDDCSPLLADGCETNIWSNQRCGGCNAGPCPAGLTCVQGTCCRAAVPCAAGMSCPATACCAADTCCRAADRACNGKGIGSVDACCGEVACPAAVACDGS